MESALTIFFQIVKMFMLMSVGFALYKIKTINDDTTARLSGILLMAVTPCTILTSFNQSYSFEKLQGLSVSFALSFIVYFFYIMLAKLFYREDDRIEKFSVVFSNAGFLGIPLVTGLFGIEAVFYLSPFIACFYLFAWTYGVVLMSGRRDSVTVKKIMTNPCIWAMILGVFVFISPVKPPLPLMEAVSMLGSMNTPLAMLILGAYMAKCPVLELFKNKRAYVVGFYRLIAAPIALIGLFCFVPDRFDQIRTIIFVAASAPVAVLIPVFAQMFDRDTGYGAQIVSLTTILCLATMPIMLMISKLVWFSF